MHAEQLFFRFSVLKFENIL